MDVRVLISNQAVVPVSGLVWWPSTTLRVSSSNVEIEARVEKRIRPANGGEAECYITILQYFYIGQIWGALF
jgi:hypothetical protein